MSTIRTAKWIDSTTGLPLTAPTTTPNYQVIDDTGAVTVASTAATHVGAGVYRNATFAAVAGRQYTIDWDGNPAANNNVTVGDRFKTSEVDGDQEAALARQGFENGWVWFDANDGVAGTTGSIGAPWNPVDNIADAKTIATARKLRTYHLLSDFAITLPVAHTNWKFTGDNEITAFIDLNGQDVFGSRFEHVVLFGTCTGFISCKLAALADVTADVISAIECTLQGTITASIFTSTFFRCITTAPGCTVDAINLTAPGSGYEIGQHSGDLTFVNIANANTGVIVHMFGGTLTLDATCTLGAIRIGGDCVLVDNSGVGCVVTDNRPGAEVSDIRKTLENREEVDLVAQELISYEDDGTTVRRRWPLETDGAEPVATATGVQTKRKPSTV